MTDHMGQQHRSGADFMDARRSVRRWRLIALGAFAAGAAAMAAAPVAAEPRPEHEGASVTRPSTQTVSAEECSEATQGGGGTPVLSTTGGTAAGYVYSGGSWGSATGDIPDGAR